MWILLLMVTLPTYVSVTPILLYPSLKGCEDERIRIAGEFAIAYPDDHTYEFVCKPVRKNHG